jgi:Flp pilus assembly pilin Flp
VGNPVPAALVEVGRAVTVGSTVVVAGVAALVGATEGWFNSVGWIFGCWTVIWGDGLGATLDVRKLLLLVVVFVPVLPF